MTFQPVSARLDVPAVERAVQAVWDERDTMARYLARNRGAEKRYSFLDGPMTANNPMGVHHAWGRTYKDLYQRYHAMLGEDQRFQNGFDCQGLWIEVEVEKELGFANKRDIESYGIDKFVEKCKQRVLRFADQISRQSLRLGYWMDWDNSYFTNSDRNNYTIWDFLKRCHQRGLIYRGHDVMPWCPRCGTGLSNMEIATEGYREIEPPVGHHQVAADRCRPGGGVAPRLDDDPLDPVAQRGRCRPPRPGLPAGGRGRRRALVAERRLARAGGARTRGRPRGARGRPGRPPLPGSVRRAAGRGRGRAPGHPVDRGRRCRGDRDRAHRPWLRRGGLRAGQAERPGGARSDRRVRASSVPATAGRAGASPAPATRAARWPPRSPRTWPPRGCWCPARSTGTATRCAGVAAPSSCSGWSTSGSSPWIRCATRSVPSPAPSAGCRRSASRSASWTGCATCATG